MIEPCVFNLLRGAGQASGADGTSMLAVGSQAADASFMRAAAEGSSVNHAKRKPAATRGRSYAKCVFRRMYVYFEASSKERFIEVGACVIGVYG